MRSSMALMAAAAALLLLLVSLAAAEVHMPYRERSEQETRRIFVEWKAKYGKTYSSIGEEERHYEMFKDKLRNIDQHNAAGIRSHRLRWRLNNSSDVTQIRRFSGGYIPLDGDGEWTMNKGAWIAYMLFVCTGFIVLFTCCRLHT